MNPKAVNTLTYTVVFPIRKGKVLLGVKKRKIFKGRWVGPGGGLEETDLSLEHCATRETFEEVRLRYKVSNLVKVAVIKFCHPGVTRIVHFYFAYGARGRPRGTKEIGTPTWFSRKTMPAEKLMPPTYPFFFKRILSGERLRGVMVYDPTDTFVATCHLYKVSTF